MTLIELNFQIQFTSDWHINAGYGAGSDVDAVLERDAESNTVINGTTIKGLFRDALYDLALNLNQLPNNFQGILGLAGQDSLWRVSAGRPSKSTTDSIVVSGVRVDPRYRRAEDNKYFNREVGSSIPIYEFSISGLIPDEKVIEQVELLVAAASYIERLGGRRRRGTGACTIRLQDESLHTDFLMSFAMRYCNEVGDVNHQAMRELITVSLHRKNIRNTVNPSGRYRIILYTERPLVISRKPESGNVYQGQTYIPGQTMRGTLASLATPSELSTDDYAFFKELFVSGGLRLSNLNPLQVHGDYGVPIAQLPMGLQRVDDENHNFTSVFQELNERKSYNAQVQLQNGLPKADKQTHVTEAHPHVAIDPDLKRASDGDLFTYEAIPAGQHFTGELSLTDHDWLKFGKLINVNTDEVFEIRMGKGRGRSYGLCKVLITTINEDEPPIWIHVPLAKRLKQTDSDVLIMTLASETIIQDTWGRFYGRFEEGWIASEFGLSEEDVSIESDHSVPYLPEQVVRTTLVQSFDSRSGVPRWRDRALMEGSTVRLRFKADKRPNLAQLHRIEVNGVGLRRNEGFGRIVFNHPAHTGQTDNLSPAISIPKQIQTSQKRLSPNEKFTRWLCDILDAEDALNRMESKVLSSMARQLQNVLSLSPEEHVLSYLNAMQQNNEIQEKLSARDYQKLSKFVAEVLGIIHQEYKSYWRVALVILIEKLLQEGNKVDAK